MGCCIAKPKRALDSTYCFTEPTQREYDEVNLAACVSYLPGLRRGKVVKVYDGDTITIATKLPIVDTAIDRFDQQWYKFPIRLRGIDAPEIKSRDVAEKQAAYAARQYMTDLVMNEMIALDNVGFDKYGNRFVATVFREKDGLNLSEEMLRTKHAVEYDGGTKAAFVPQ